MKTEFYHPWIFLDVFLFSFFSASQFLVCLLSIIWLFMFIYIFIFAVFIEAQMQDRFFISTVLFMFFELSI